RALFELEFGEAFSIGDKFIVLGVVSIRFGGIAGHGLDCSCEHDGQLGLISCACFLQSALFH
ncbi:MAG: hypothetical protein K2I19_02010, partial [Muribaculaceae bacterium]|nr:hypothetical protein [Muribaculaceae bacterium]